MFPLLLARNESFDRWLEQNPLINAAFFGVLGAVLVVVGILNLITRKATGKFGSKSDGWPAMVMGGIRVVVGIIALCVALFALGKAHF